MRKSAIAVAVSVGFLAACGGGGTSSSSGAASTAANTTPSLSGDQQLYESLALGSNGGIHNFSWNLPLSGSPSSASGHYFQYGRLTINSSPAFAGAQSVQWTPSSVSNLLPLPRTLTSSRYLKGKAIYLHSINPENLSISYSNDSVIATGLTDDGKTALFANKYSAYSSSSLMGNVADLPAELKSYFGNLFTNPALLKSSAVWASGASYLKHTSTTVDARIVVDDCVSSQTFGATPAPCASNISLAAYAKNLSGSDVTASIVTFEGVPVWLAKDIGGGTPSSMVYFELNSNVYRGTMTQAGVQFLYPRVSGNVTNYVTWYPRFNAAAVNSLKSAINF